MFFIDSWIWIEYFSDGHKYQKAREIIERLKEDKGSISTIVLTEVRYRITQRFGIHVANHLLQIVNSLSNLSILPVTSTIAVYAADLRTKYYSTKNQLSYADVIHLATATLSGCDVFYTGDPDFSDIEEIKVQII